MLKHKKVAPFARVLGGRSELSLSVPASIIRDCVDIDLFPVIKKTTPAEKEAKKSD